MTIPFFSKAKRGEEQPHGKVRIFVPKDAAAVACGADAVAAAIARSAAQTGVPVEIVRNGSRGLLWLEPLVELEMGGIRYGFGPIEPETVGSLLNAGLLRGDLKALSAHPHIAGRRSTRSTTSPARRASPSRAAVSSIRCRSTPIARSAATRASRRRCR